LGFEEPVDSNNVALREIMRKTIVVAGICRSGLSLTMQMLYAGGYPCVGTPPAFEEYPVGTIPWNQVRGKAVKVVDTHIQFPPDYVECDVLRLYRKPEEQAKSFNKFMGAFGYPPLRLERIIQSYKEDYEKIDDWCRNKRTFHPHFEGLIDGTELLVKEICHWIGDDSLDQKKMIDCVVKRSSRCYPGMLETKLIDHYDSIGR